MTDDPKNKEDKEYFKKLNNVIDFSLFHEWNASTSAMQTAKEMEEAAR